MEGEILSFRCDFVMLGFVVVSNFGGELKKMVVFVHWWLGTLFH